MEESAPVGVHLVGSVPLGSAEEVFRTVAGAIGDRVRRMPDGETGARSDWIVWQYPLFSSRPQFEIGPPGASSYRALPQLRLRTGEDTSGMAFEELGYASAAMDSYRTFARLKREGTIAPGCRFLVSLPTPLAPVSAFVALEHQAELEPVYEAQMRKEVERIVAAIPADQLAIQWDARYEFAMLEGAIAVWFEDVHAGVVERLLRLGRMVPSAVELGFHLCYGDDEHGHFAEPADAGRLVGVANALAALDRPLNWIHMPVPRERDDDAYYAPLGELRLHPETELYLGLLHAGDEGDGARRRIAAARGQVERFGVATECGWGRGGAGAVAGLLALHREISAPLPDGGPPAGAEAFRWPPGFVRVPDEDWDDDEPGIAYDHVDAHGWYRTLDLTVEDLARTLEDGDLLLDYSGGTGTLLDRLRLRIDRPVGVVIVDPSPRFLRVAREKYGDDPLVGLRDRLDGLDVEFDALACTNAIHLYPDLGQTLGDWMRALRPGARVFINSGNIRNPRAKPAEWILDETVWVINDLAEGLVRSDPRYVHYREAVDDAARMRAHADHRNRVFLQARPLEHYVGALGDAGFEVLDVREETIEAKVSEWFEFLSAYHEAVLGWVGGADPTPGALRDRLHLIRHAMETLFGGRPSFNACWTYISARRPSDPAAPPRP